MNNTLKIMVTIPKEDYIKAVFTISFNGNGKVSTKDISEKLEVSNAATSEMARKLSLQGLINYEKYKGISLTAKGEKLALKILRRHRLWELFLIQILGLSWSEVHDQAERLEHHTTEFLIDKIDEHLGFPEFDPHGHPIPRKNGQLPKQPEVTALSEAKIGSSYKLVCVKDESKELMDYLTSIGLQLHTEIRLINKLSFDDSVFVQINKKQISFSKKIADKLSVSVIKN